MNSGNEFEFQSNTLPGYSFNSFRDMKERKEYCDVVLRVADVSIPAHSIVIAAAIPYLRNALLNKSAQGEVIIPEVDDLNPGAIQSMIEYAYHGKVRSNVENTTELLKAACRFEMDEMREACCSFIADNLSPENVMRIRNLVSQLGCQDLVQGANKYITENFEKISETEEFLNCPFADLKEFIKRDDLLVENEEKVYESVMKWVSHIPERERHLAELISDVRLVLLDASYLRLRVAKNELIRSSSQCRDWVDEVTTYTMFPKEVKLSLEFNTQPRRYVSANDVKTQDEHGGNCCSEDNVCDKNTENANRGEESIQPEQLGNFRNSSDADRKQDESRRQQHWCGYANCNCDEIFRTPRESDLQHSCASADHVSSDEDEEPGGIYAFHAKLGFVIQHLDQRTKRWLVKKRDFFTINTALVTGLNDRICFLDCENMCYYNPSSNEISFTDRYVQGRASVAAGDHLYVFGGSDGSAVFDSAECLNVESEEWSELESMKMCREYASCVALGDYLYVIGGNDFESIHTTVERYDIEESHWSFVEPTLIGRSKLGAAALNGKIYICGGMVSLVELECATTAEVYDPNIDQWIPICPLNTTRVMFTLLPYTGKLYAVGGHDENDDYVNKVDVYNPRTGKWKLGYTIAPELQITGAAVTC